jgi:hypothetical protein
MLYCIQFSTKTNIFLTSALVAGECSASRPGRFTPGERTPRYPLDRRLGGPQSRSGRHGEVKILAPTGTWTPISWSWVQVVERKIRTLCWLTCIDLSRRGTSWFLRESCSKIMCQRMKSHISNIRKYWTQDFLSPSKSDNTRSKCTWQLSQTFFPLLALPFLRGTLGRLTSNSH